MEVFARNNFQKYKAKITRSAFWCSSTHPPSHTLTIFYVKYRNYLHRQVAERPKYPRPLFELEEICRILCTVCPMYDTIILGRCGRVGGPY